MTNHTMTNEIDLINAHIRKMTGLLKGMTYTNVFSGLACGKNETFTNFISSSHQQKNMYFMKTAMFNTGIITKTIDEVLNEFEGKQDKTLNHVYGKVHGIESKEARIERFKGALIANLVKTPSIGKVHLLDIVAFEFKFHQSPSTMIQNLDLLEDAFEELVRIETILITEEIEYAEFCDYEIELVHNVANYKLTEEVKHFHNQLVNNTQQTTLTGFIEEVMHYAGNAIVLNSLIQKFALKNAKLMVEV